MAEPSLGNTVGALKPNSVSTKQRRIADLARTNPKMAFTSLNHHLDEEWLRYAYDLTRKDGATETQQREAYDRGNGAAILLYNPEQQTVILTRQFRMPTFVNGNPDGMMIEACAGLLDDDD